jgi:acetyltransferase-like isoleucine patch superfamily enzyme
MIESTSVVYPPSSVHSEAYVGHFAIIGHPRRVVPDLARTGSLHHWEQSAGASIGRRAVVSAYTHIDDGTIVEEGVWIGSRCRIGHDSRIRRSAQLYYSCQVFDRVDIGESAVVAGFVCNDARVGFRSQVFGILVHRLVDAPAGGADPRPTDVEPPPVVEEEAIVGVGAIVIGGITVGKGAYIAAGAVLTRDAEPYTLYKGSPARAFGVAPRAVSS